VFETHGVVRDVFVQICEHQEQLQHAVALFGARLFGALFQIFHRGQRVGEQPFEAFFAERNAFAAAGQGQIGADESFIEKMIETQLGGGERGRSGVRASGAIAMDGSGGCHFSNLEAVYARGPKDAGEISTHYSDANEGEF
jgi:hypothetical protein